MQCWQHNNCIVKQFKCSLVLGTTALWLQDLGLFDNPAPQGVCLYPLSDSVPVSAPAKKVQSLYDSLEAKDSEIYCQRAREMYSTLEPENTGLFVYSMDQVHLHAMFDPNMLGEEKLIEHLKDIDSTR